MSAPSSLDRCLNCDEPLRGRFCHHCGQKATDINRPLRQLTRDFFTTFVSFDTRLLRTLRPLIWKPGSLTVDYNAGRRVRYVPPLTLYVFLSFLLFVALSMSGYSAVTVNDESPSGAKLIVKERTEDTDEEEEIEDTDEGAVAGEAEENEDTDEEAVADRFMVRFFEAYAENPQRFDAVFQDYMAKTVILLVPVFALLLKIFYLKSGKLYVQHLVMSLHVHSFSFLILTVEALLGLAIGPWEDAVGLAGGLWILIYLFLALRRVYGGGRLWTAIKLSGLLFSHMMILVSILLGTLILTVLLY